MTACFVCGAEITENQPTVAARIITPGPGLVQACSGKCAVDPKFADPHGTRQLVEYVRPKMRWKLSKTLNDRISKAWRRATGAKP
jgi:hypothetical protein